VRVGLGHAQRPEHGFLPRVLQAATVQGEEAGQAAGGSVEAVREMRLRVHGQRQQRYQTRSALLGLLGDCEAGIPPSPQGQDQGGRVASEAAEEAQGQEVLSVRKEAQGWAAEVLLPSMLFRCERGW
jgi:hypothetical protein